MANQEGTGKRGISRRQFLTLAGAGAVVGAVLLFATRNKGISGLLKATSGNQAARVNQATAGKRITTRSQVSSSQVSPLTSQSFFSRLFGGKL